MKKLFIFNDQINIYGKELEMAYNRFSEENSVDFITLNKLSIELLKEQNIKVVIADNLPYDWLYILKGMKIVSLIFGDANKYHNEADIVIDYKGNDSVKYFSGDYYSIKNLDFNISEVVNIISKLSWDSNFFGYPIAYVSSRYLSDNIQNVINFFVKQNNIKLVQFLCNCHDNFSVKVAEKNGYHFTDIRITFSLFLKKYLEVSDETILPGKFELARIEHIENLCTLTNFLYNDSRYFYDGNFEFDRINLFYSEWVKKAVIGSFDHECYCYFEDDKPLSFCTVRYEKNKLVNIGLFGVGSSYIGNGIGKALLNYVIKTMKIKGFLRINVVTQGRNYAAQNLYQSVGFRTISTELWYHKWVTN